MKRLKLDIPALISQKVHHHLQIGFRGDVSRHDIVVGPIKKNLAEQFKRLSFRHVIGRKDKRIVHVEKLLPSSDKHGNISDYIVVSLLDHNWLRYTVQPWVCVV